MARAARTSTSSAARRAQLEYEAAKKKAAIEKELIDKKLAADIAALSQYSGSVRSRSRSQNEREVGEWLDRNDAQAPPSVSAPHNERNDVHDIARELKNMLSETKQDSNKPLLTRLAIGKDLPIYSGDPVEWLHFKEAYQESTRLCNYSDSENLWRLRKCLRGEAKDTVSSLLIGSTSPFEVLEALELRYGRSSISIEEDVLVTTPTPYEVDPDAELSDLVRYSFSFEAIGVHNKPRQNAEEVRAVAILEGTTRLVDGRWEVGLPWKDDESMPNSYPTAYRRLKSVEKKIYADKEYGDRYRERINHLFINNYARQVDDPEPGNRTWYLPHFGVDNPNKKKLRVVFDAAAPSEGKNLNSYLLQGPDLLESLLGIMFKFREGPIALMGDIKDMFLCIKIRKEDQKALRFLWRDDASQPIKVYAMTSLIFGANCSPFIAQYIKNKNAQRFIEEMPEAVNAVISSHYMDDYIDSVNDVTTAKRMIKDISAIHLRGGFEIRNWVSNAPQVLAEMPNEVKAVQFNVNNNQPERTLGLLWFPPEDTLSIDLTLKRIPSDILNHERKPTKREMLRIIMSILDIYGFLSPITIKAKILMRETWKNNIKWDQELSEDLYNSFRAWITQMNEVSNLKIPRWYFDKTACSTCDGLNESETATLELHLFCDASQVAYCAVAYWRRTDRGGRVIIALIASKCRVAPIRKPVSVPRLELQAATLACRLANTIKNEHRIKPTATYYWTDSMTVLHWIKNDCRNYKVFVANRLGEIDELSSKNEWNYISTHINIADVATKSCNYKLDENCEWFRGPKFLYEDSANWITEPEKEKKIKLNDEDLEMVNLISNKNENELLLPVPDSNRFSSWLRLVRSTARVIQFIEKCRKRPVDLNAGMLEKAELILIKFSQMQSFSIELKMLQSKKAIPRDSRLRALTPVIDEHGLLRVGGRIDAAKDVSADLKRPVILDGRHPTSKLIVKSYHEAAAHGSTEMIVNELRQKYWIINMRPTVRSVAAKCLHCRIRRASPQPPRLGNLPEARVDHHFRPFTNCGVDLFGPMAVAIGRRREKRYGVLFTCLTVRAIHIEVVHSLTTDSMIMALRRMAAKRSWPKKIFSDNGTNLKGTEAELRKSYLEIVNDKGLHEQLANRLVEWSFIVPGTPHMAGAWERLIRSVKTALKVILKERAPQEETLLTLLAEIENMINSRPLTHVSVDHRDPEALTPNHFLLGSSSNLPRLGSFNNDEFYLRKQWRIAQRLADLFWARWVKEVLPVLLPRKKWQDEAPTLKKGDVVLIADPQAPRGTWPKGVIAKTILAKMAELGWWT
nr:uncharacterized protein LOC117992679 [Maniola hyperantus]